LSAIIRIGLLLVLIVSCNSYETTVDPLVKRETVYFPPTEVVSALNALVAIIDWPAETTAIQKNLSVTPSLAKKLMLPLHPIWDEKVNEVAMEILDWDKAKITSSVLNCSLKCECDFYHEVLDRNPAILEKAGPELKTFAGVRVDKTKEATLKCLQSMPSVQNILTHLNLEQKKYEAESVY
jgi:hypothetical protein